jgi:hypothetical protein
MTIEAWNIILSAAILVLMTAGGFWLKYLVDQQLKTKDTTIEALKGVVQVKDAHIAALEGNTAPEIVKAYTVMREHADLMTGQLQRLAAQIVELGKQQQESQQMLLPKILGGEIMGLRTAVDILDENVLKSLIHDGIIDPKFAAELRSKFFDGLMTTAEEMRRQATTHLGIGEGLDEDTLK